ncbi:MAG: Dihydrofolate reductase [Candidatus Saccharibacteria bacterium]|nr:Dihydrofolate reductase [Candidatus Saccharibacteria bacterium]
MTLEKPMGDMTENILHRWMFEEPEKHEAELATLTSAGAFIMGRNMFGPKNLQNDPEWKGWWGDNPPYHGPVFVLSYSEREPITMEGGTTFTFVTDGIEEAFRLAKEAAGDKDIAISGGANTINQYLAAGLIDELWLHIAPAFVGKGQRLFLDMPEGLHLKPVEARTTELVTHIKYSVDNTHVH